MQNLLLTFVMTVGVFVAVFILMSLGYFVYHVAIKGTCAQLREVGFDCDCKTPCVRRRIKNFFAGKDTEAEGPTKSEMIEQSEKLNVRVEK
ncbi:MAG: hypothetical protein MR757_02570 [Proteobacteria bacterium]|jgi:hypothetical protein|nr:hypothetical protein [Pseudomonadota bacterium]MDD6546748.1 hypothetical protein [Pseudomonadota bacterium]MDY6336680.1 hypothetical protein [Succinivibrionaceae bacterium]MDY6375661.1 hypothetical protein [Succinivibrionaceae bacterium]